MLDEVDAFGTGGDLFEARVGEDRSEAGQQILALIIHAPTLERLGQNRSAGCLWSCGAQVWMRLLGPSWASAVGSLNQ
ncbi:hypothetical protein ACS04_28970 [Streptomyces roseus]|uniref:Uncharacterized protein n=1 Tax=Streptomyces roseus TaxID=66430 RepID=A0A0J6XF86_9ACTN|nr:hypothetical protein ACS04_28970 [Streptomyces roseus]